MKTVVTIRATKGASQRTKNRIRENGGRFLSERGNRRTIGLFQGRGVQFFEAVGDDRFKWCGWIPLDEFEEVEDG